MNPRAPQTFMLAPTRPVFEVEKVLSGYHGLSIRAGTLSRFLWWCLEKLRVLDPHYDVVQTWTFIPEDHPALVQRVFEAVRTVDNHRSLEDVVVVMGAKDFQELTGAPHMPTMFTVEVGPFSRQGPYYGRELFGLPVHIVPYVSGFAILPKAIVERTKP